MTTKEEIAYWEQVLIDDGLAEISLFDNTGKNKNVTFISTTIPSDTGASGNVSIARFDDQSIWHEHVNVDRYGEQTSISDMDSSVYFRNLSCAVLSLPAGWPSVDKDLLLEYADSGIFEAAMRKVGMTKNAAYAAKRRFEAWRKNTTGC